MKNFLKPLLLFVMGASVLSCSNDDDSSSNIPGDSQPSTAYLYATSHNGSVTRYDINEEDPTVNYQTESSDAEGIYYDDDGSFTIVSRDPSQLQNYADVNQVGDDVNVDLTINTTGTTDFSSGRDVAEDDDFYIVADNSDVDGDENTPDGRFYVYTKNSTGFQLRNVVTVNFSVWGIVIEDNNLYAVVDKTNELAVFNNFLSTYTTNETATASKRVAVEGIVRTHGLDLDDNTMVMTDIGDAASDSDGGLHIINNFSSVLSATEDGGMISLDNQARISGSNTSLGNPVNVVYDDDYDTAYVAEVANGGGRVLSFNNIRNNGGGNITPQVNNILSGASSVYLYTE
jgi:hypothetical protein